MAKQKISEMRKLRDEAKGDRGFVGAGEAPAQQQPRQAKGEGKAGDQQANSGEKK